MARAADPLEERRDGLGRPHLHHQVDVGHVDAEFEAGRSRDHVEVAALESRLDRLPTVGREAAVVTRRIRVVVVEALAQGLERPLGARAGVGKDQRVGVGVDQVVQLLVEPAPDRLVRRPDEVVDRAVDLQVELAGEPGVDDLAVAWLAALPDERVECDGRVKIVHGHPDDPDRYTYPDQFSPRLLDDEDVLVMGHTHVQGYEQYEESIVMNPGSVGQPRDGDPRAAYAVLDLDALTVDEHRVEYDVDAVREAVAAAGLPREIGSRLEKGR